QAQRDQCDELRPRSFDVLRANPHESCEPEAGDDVAAEVTRSARDHRYRDRTITEKRHGVVPCSPKRGFPVPYGHALCNAHPTLALAARGSRVNPTTPPPFGGTPPDDRRGNSLRSRGRRAPITRTALPRRACAFRGSACP